MIVESKSLLTFPSSIPTYALRRFPELTTFLSKLGHPSATVTPISFRDRNLSKSISKISYSENSFPLHEEGIKNKILIDFNPSARKSHKSLSPHWTRYGITKT